MAILRSEVVPKFGAAFEVRKAAGSRGGIVVSWRSTCSIVIRSGADQDQSSEIFISAAMFFTLKG
jgi:hypothetical protein